MLLLLYFVPTVIRWCPWVAPFVRSRKYISVSLKEKLVFFASIGFNSFRVWCTISVFLLTEMNEMLNRLKRGPSQYLKRVETSKSSGDETDSSKGRRNVLSKRTFRMKKVYAATELGWFLVTGPSDAANMPSPFYCLVCGKNVSVLTHGHHDIMKCCGISKAVATLPVISACVWDHLGGACWISTEIL